MHATSRTLPFGTFYGQSECRHAAPGLELALLRVDPHRVVERHSHDEAHLVLVLDGLYVSSADGAPPVSTGRALVFNPAGTTHRDRFEARQGIMSGQFLTLSVAEEIMAHASAEWGTSPRAIALQSPAAMATACRLASACVVGGATLLERESLALTLLAHIPGERASRSVARDAPGWLDSVRAHLNDALGTSPSIRDIARTAGVHPVHLARVFRQHVGVSPGEYHRRRRLDQATTLIRETGRPLAEISLACGFVDQAHLTRDFRRAMGTTPSAYRHVTRGSSRPAAV